MTQDFELVKDIFALLDAGIIDGYDAFRYEAELGEGFMQEELTVERNGSKTSDAGRDYNGAVLFKLLKALKQNAENRGEPWQGVTLSYRQGEQVKINFSY